MLLVDLAIDSWFIFSQIERHRLLKLISQEHPVVASLRVQVLVLLDVGW